MLSGILELKRSGDCAEFAAPVVMYCEAVGYSEFGRSHSVGGFMVGVIKTNACGELVIPENSFWRVGSSYSRTPRARFSPNGLLSLAVRASIDFQKRNL